MLANKNGRETVIWGIPYRVNTRVEGMGASGGLVSRRVAHKFTTTKTFLEIIYIMDIPNIRRILANLGVSL